MEIRPPIPFPLARVEHTRGSSAVRLDPELDDWVYAMRLEEQLDEDLLATDGAAAGRRRVVGRIRIVALITAVLSVVAVVRIGSRYGVGVGIVGVWALPAVVLAVVLSAEKVLLRFSR